DRRVRPGAAPAAPPPASPPRAAGRARFRPPRPARGAPGARRRRSPGPSAPPPWPGAVLHRDRRDRHRGIVPPPPARDERRPGRRWTAAARPATLDGDAEVGETVTATSAQGGRALRRPARPGWSRLLAWLRSLLAAPRLALAAPPLERRWGAGAAALP